MHRSQPFFSAGRFPARMDVRACVPGAGCFSADSQESRAEFFGKRVYIEIVELRRRLDFWNLRRECGVERIL